MTTWRVESTAPLVTLLSPASPAPAITSLTSHSAASLRRVSKDETAGESFRIVGLGSCLLRCSACELEE